MNVPREIRSLLRSDLEVMRLDRRGGGIVALLLRDPKRGNYGWKSLEISLKHRIANREDRWTTERSATETYDMWSREYGGRS